MAVVVRFNTAIARRDAVAGRYAGGVDAFFGLLKGSDVPCFVADEHLIAAYSMSTPWNFAEIGLREGDDFCFANQSEDWTPTVEWLRTQRVEGLPICWLASRPSGYISDSKPGWLMRRWAVQSCPSCGRELGFLAAVAGISFAEIDHGPLVVVTRDHVDTIGPWRLTCCHCGARCRGNGNGDVQLL